MLLEGGGACLALSLVAALAGLSLTLVRRTRRWGLLLVTASAGMADYGLSSLPPAVATDSHIYSAEVTEVPPGAGRNVVMAVADTVDGRPMRPIAVRLTLDPSLDTPGEGMRVIFRASLRPVDGNVTLPDETIPYPGTDATAFVASADLLDIVPAHGFRAMMSRQRERVNTVIYRSELSPGSKRFLSTALLGRRGAMASDTREAFARAGLSHILALSGMHVAIIIALLYWALAPTLLLMPRHARSLVIIAAVWGYASLTGLDAPVVRASVMVTVWLAADMVQRRASPLNSLATAALVILLLTPAALSDIGFILSFLAVASIILFADALNPFGGSSRRILRTLGEAIGVSMAAMMATGLVSALAFHSLPLLFLAANIVTGPLLIPVILGGGMIVIAASMAGLSCGIVTASVDMAVDTTARVASLIASIPWASVEIWALEGATVFMLIATLAAIGVRLRRRGGTAWLTPVAAVLAVATLCSASSARLPAPDSPGTWYWLPSTDAMDLLIPAADSLYLITDAPASTRRARADALMPRLGDYMGRRGIAGIAVADGALSRPGLTLRGNHLLAGDRRLIIAGNGYRIPPGGYGFVPDAIIFTRYFRGDPAAVASALGAAEVYLSPAIHNKVRERHRRALDEAGIAYRD